MIGTVVKMFVVDQALASEALDAVKLVQNVA